MSDHGDGKSDEERGGMGFGKRRTGPDTSVPVVDWATATEFTVSTVVKYLGAGRKRPVFGRQAVRVPIGEPGDRVYAPCAFFAPDSIRRTSVAAAYRLYEDEAAQRPLCSLDDAEEVDGERHSPKQATSAKPSTYFKTARSPQDEKGSLRRTSLSSSGVEGLDGGGRLWRDGQGRAAVSLEVPGFSGTVDRLERRGWRGIGRRSF